MAALLGAGDSFHLVPRSYALWTNGLEANAAALGFGKFVTSITMTVFYLILYYIWLDRLLIDARFQGRGYGRAALEALLERLSREYPEQDVYLSVIEGNDVATRLYEQYGFRFIGEKDIHGEDVMVRAWDGNLIG